jgi:catechol-2,3-dioxygenase
MDVKKIMENPTSLDFVSFQVRDITLSKKFYHDNLGFRVEDETRPDAIVFSTGMVQFLLYANRL